MELRSNNRIWRAWNKAIKYGYFTPSYWSKYVYLCHEHCQRLDQWMDRELMRA
jgi:hypothetical protein